jgi:predicted ATP-binding protein involved in virulence
MYIQKAEIKNIRSIEKFEIEFKNPAGWHVLIGENGAGKSTIIRSIALALVGEEFQGLREVWDDWLNKQSNEGKIIVSLSKEDKFDQIYSKNEENIKNTDKIEIVFHKDEKENFEIELDEGQWIHYKIFGFFSVAYGPYRRFEGGNSLWEKVFKNSRFSRLAAHLSVFGEDIALTEPIEWLKNLQYLSLERVKESDYVIENLKKLINHKDKDGSFLQHNTKLESVSSSGVFFKDGNGVIISVNQMSDGYRSFLSMTFELIRQLLRVYGSKKVFKNIEKGEMFIDLPGVVLVDEIDAHLHPTWQTRIGNWFLKYFPRLQFIVTTHSPLVCRAAKNGSIWRLAAPGSDEKSGEITGLDRERLIYGNVLDAYGTGVFGDTTSISEDSNEMLNRLSELNVKSMMGLINDEENEELEKLRSKFPTESALKK